MYSSRLLVGMDWGYRDGGSSLRNSTFWEVALQPVLVNKGYFVVKNTENVPVHPFQKKTEFRLFFLNGDIMYHYAIFVEDLLHGGKGGLI